MNRRKFIQSLAAAFALPAAPVHLLKPAMAAIPATATAASAAAIATKARFWTIYMYGLHGNCTPATLSTMLNIPESQARGYLTNLVADGTIRPEALLRNSLTKAMKSDGDGMVEKLQERLEIKREAKAPEAKEKTNGDEQALETDDDLPEKTEDQDIAPEYVEEVETDAEMIKEMAESDKSEAANDVLAEQDAEAIVPKQTELTGADRSPSDDENGPSVVNERAQIS